MIQIPTHEAKTHLSRYLERAQRGETIVITRGKRPMAKLVPLESVPQVEIPKVGQTLDPRMEVPEEAWQPLTRIELDGWGL